MTTFQIGQKYMMRSICDYDCIWVYTVVARTAATITIKDEKGKQTKCRISKGLSEFNKAESVKPLGSYSMSPILTAEKIYK